jgi:hypothetical protein
MFSTFAETVEIAAEHIKMPSMTYSCVKRAILYIAR